jgi:2,3-bisphosphoglycerate-dependent phosphoglycerate mutase
MLKELFLIRHGHPQQGTGMVYDRVPGPPLSDVGKEEARIAGLFLAHMRIERIYSSPLDRAQQTAQIIGAQVNRQPVIEALLAEHRKEEKFEDVRMRIDDLLVRLAREPYAHVALVAHGSPIKALLLALSHDQIKLDDYKFANGNHVPTAGVWHARQAEAGWQLDLIFKPIVATPLGHLAV